MIALYLETSAVLRVLFERDRALAERIADARCVASVLTFAEAGRAIVRAGKARAGCRKQLELLRSACDVLPLDEPVLARAIELFPVEPVRTLDALHLATALLWRSSVEPLAVASADDRVRVNAAALGFALVPAVD